MTIQNYTKLDDIIVPTNDKFTYRGLGGDDKYILISNSNTNIDIVDTEGNNTIQLPEWSKIKSIAFTSDAVRITCDNMAVFTVNGADKFNFDIGGNKTSNSLGKASTYSEFASLFDLEIPASGQVSLTANKIVYNDKLTDLIDVEVKEIEYNAWHSKEHMLESISLPRILRGFRAVGIPGTDLNHNLQNKK